MSTDYNGWKNRATWNVFLWLSNDQHLYLSMVEYANLPRKPHSTPHYAGFIRWAGLWGLRTPDGFKYDGQGLDYKALDEVVRECIQK